MNRHRCAENCDWRNVGAVLSPNPMKCCGKICRPFNERDRAATLRFQYPERPTFPAFASTWQRPAFRAVDVLPRFPIKPARFRDVPCLVRDDPCSNRCAAISECGEPKNAGGSRRLDRFKRQPTQRSELLQIVRTTALQKIERHRLQLAATPVLRRL